MNKFKRSVEGEAFEWSVDYEPCKEDLYHTIQGYVIGYEAAEMEYIKSMPSPLKDKKKDKKIKDLESQVNKFKVIFNLRNKVESLEDILSDVMHWNTCPDKYKKRIAETLGLEFEEEEENDYEDDEDDLF